MHKSFFQNLKVLEKSILVHRGLEEALLFLLVMCVPVSYVAGMVAGTFCTGFESIDEHDMELNKVEFYYPKVTEIAKSKLQDSISSP